MKLFHIIKLIVFFCILIVAYRYVRMFSEEFKKIFDISWYQFLIFSLLILISLGINGLRLKILTNIFNISLKPKEWFGLSVVNTMGNYLAFKSGMAANSIYLKNRHNFPYATFVSTLAGSLIIVLLTVSICGIMASSIITYAYGKFNLLLTIMFLLILLCVALLLFLPRLSEHTNRVVDFFIRIVNSFNRIKKDTKNVQWLIFIEFCSLLFFSLRLWYAYRILGLPIPLIYCLLMSPLITLSSLISISPADMGVREAIIGFTSQFLGKGFSQGISAASLDRFVSIIWIFTLGIMFSMILFKRKDGTKNI